MVLRQQLEKETAQLDKVRDQLRASQKKAASQFSDASREMMARTGGQAFPVIFTELYNDEQWSWVEGTVGRATGRPVLN